MIIYKRESELEEKQNEKLKVVTLFIQIMTWGYHGDENVPEEKMKKNKI